MALSFGIGVVENSAESPVVVKNIDQTIMNTTVLSHQYLGRSEVMAPLNSAKSGTSGDRTLRGQDRRSLYVYTNAACAQFFIEGTRTAYSGNSVETIVKLSSLQLLQRIAILLGFKGSQVAPMCDGEIVSSVSMILCIWMRDFFSSDACSWHTVRTLHSVIRMWLLPPGKSTLRRDPNIWKLCYIFGVLMSCKLLLTDRYRDRWHVALRALPLEVQKTFWSRRPTN